jgi:UDP-N-acetylglucosamine--N-acetylmuramyl-(pentapeptide) pyrophosphoryl-undecaprenol N-acetylglucosamine transferase
MHKFIISGGGTGGHIFPAIAIANEIKHRESNAEILFVGAKGKMEMEKVPSAGYKIIGLTISGIRRSFSISNLLVPFKFFKALIDSRRIINDFKPDVAIGVGGFASGAILYAAASKNIPTVIQEQNAHAGITNKFLGKKADKICVAFDGMEKFFPSKKIILTGNPVRQEIVNQVGKRETGQKLFNLNPETFTVLVIGGSLGALSINESITDGIEKIKESGIQLIWQTGKPYYEKAKAAVKAQNASSISVFDFIKEMDLAYASADLVVSRAGAIAVSELCLVKKPSILVPFPFAAEDHQTQNALTLVNAGAAVMVKDENARKILVNEMLELVKNKSLQQTMIQNCSKIGKENAAAKIVDEIFSLIPSLP